MLSVLVGAANLLLCGFAAILGLLLLAIFIYNAKHSRRNKLVDKLPGPQTTFLFGNSLSFLAKREDLFQAGVKLFTPYNECPLYRIWFGPFPQIVIHDVHVIEAILSSPKLINKAFAYTYLKPWLGQGLLLSSENKWHTRRKMITPSFHFTILEEFFPIIKEQGEILISILKQYDGRGAFDIYPFVARCTLDIICETAMGRNIKAQRKSESEYVKAVNSLAEIINVRLVSPWLHPDFAFNLTSYGRNQKKCLRIVHGFTDQVINEKKKQLLEQNKKSNDLKPSDESDIYGKKQRKAFLDMLLESSNNGEILTDADIREEVDTFMFEGHDTTASGINWTLYNIARLPDVQSKIHEELDQVFGDSDRPITSSDLKALKYLECVIKETMRLFPPVPFFGRQFKEDINVCGFTLPAGVDTIFTAYRNHRNPKYFPDPEKFDPDRFLLENSSKRHPYAYLPFSAGARNCIGQKFAIMEEKIIVSQVMRRFKITAMEKLDDLKVVAELIFRPVSGIWLKIESRS